MSKKSQETNSEEIENMEPVNGQETQVVEEEKNVEQEESTTSTNSDEELEAAKDRYLRLYSEFENFRRRTSKEKRDLISTATRELMTSLIPVIDDFDRAMHASQQSQDVEALREGVSLIHAKFNKVLTSQGLKKMEVTKGDEFDDEKHEAITQIPSDKELEGKVVDVVEPGYLLGESILRFAKVVVGARQ